MNKKKSFTLLVLLIIFLFAVVLLISRDKTSPISKNNLEKVRVQTGWIINGEFANICSALVNGYYADNGLDVEIVPGGPTGASFILATNAIAQDPSLTIGIEGDTVPLIRGKSKEIAGEKLHVKAFAAFWNTNPYGFIVRKDSGLNNIKDFAKRKPDGKKYKIGVTSDSIIQNALANDLGISVSDMDIVIVGFDSTPFLTGQVDAQAGFWTSLSYEADKAGIPNNFISASEISGFNQPAMVVEATEKTLTEKPELLSRWLQATIKGSDFIIKSPEIASQQILDKRCGGPTLNQQQEEWLIKKSVPLFDTNKIGWVYESQITDFAKTFYKLGQIPFVPSSEDLIDYSILKTIYK